MTKKKRRPENVALGRRIAHAREKLGLTQEQLALAFDVHEQTVSKWETGEHPPDGAARRFLEWLSGVRLPRMERHPTYHRVKVPTLPPVRDRARLLPSGDVREVEVIVTPGPEVAPSGPGVSDMIVKDVMPLIAEVWRRFHPTEQINALAALAMAWEQFGDVQALNLKLAELVKRSIQNREATDGPTTEGLADRDRAGGLP